jgi:diguanylate cyclase (GGDEF)-like protein/PAS domain S-box-containing protein
MNFDTDAYERIIENLHEGLYLVDTDRVITYWNKAAELITGFSAEEIIGKACRDNVLTHVTDRGKSLCLGLCPLSMTMNDGGPRETQVFLHHRDGHRVPVHVRVNPLTDASGKVIGGVELFTDISSQEVTELRIRELERLALLDNLTRLANRHYIERELFSRFEEYRRSSISFGILFFDIDHFKSINDTHGHHIGDEVIKYVANTLMYNARPFDIFGRWGGEEFIGIVKNVDEGMLRDIGERMRSLIAESYVMKEGERISVTVSIGATLACDDDDADRLLTRADKLLYQSKHQGRNVLTYG